MYTPDMKGVIIIQRGFEMAFCDDFKDIKAGRVKGKTQKDFFFSEVKARSGCNFPFTQPSDFTSNIYKVLDASDCIYEELTENNVNIDVSVIGAVTEEICQLGLQVAAPQRYGRLPKTWEWVGDFAITGIPFNLFISVKSYKAKERLIVSGTGQFAAPIIGFGLFDDISEWSERRVLQYKQRGFLAIYVPDQKTSSLSGKPYRASGKENNLPNNLYSRLAAKRGSHGPVTDIENIYGNKLIRPLESFAQDIAKLIKTNLELDLSRL